jgi:tetratricopeptide (TPR) repeat protein
MKARILLILFLACPALGDDRLTGVAQMIFTGRAADARIRIIEAQTAYRAEANAEQEAISFLLLGMADVALQDAPAARVNLNEATRRLGETNDPFGSWMALWMLASLERREGKFEVSVAMCDRALVALSDAAVSTAPFSMEGLKTLATFFGGQADVFDMLGSDNAQLFKPILLMFAEAVTRDAYADVLIEMGELKKAEAELTKARALSRMFEGVLDSSLEQRTGDLRRRQWRFDEAREAYKKALGGVGALPNLASIHDVVNVQIYLRLAEIEMLSGRADEALGWSDKALAIVRAGSDPHQVVDVLEERADVLMRFSRMGEAETILNEAMTLAVQSKNIADQASILSKLGAVNMVRGRYGTAAQQLEKAVAHFQTLNLPYYEAATWTLLAEIYVMTEASGSAGTALEHARDLAKHSNFKLAATMVEVIDAARKFMAGKGTKAALEKAFANWWKEAESNGLMMDPGSQNLLRALLNLGAGDSTNGLDAIQLPSVPLPIFNGFASMMQAQALLQRGDVTGARTLLQQALKDNPNADLRAGYLALIGATYWREGSREDSVRYFVESADAIEKTMEDIQVEELLTGYLGASRRAYFEIVVDWLVRQGRVAQAFDFAERARARAFLQLVGNIRVKPAYRDNDPLAREAEVLRLQIKEWERKQIAAATITEIKRYTRELEQARDRYNAIVTRLKAASPDYTSASKIEPLSLEEVRKELPADATMISYFVSQFGVHAWLLDGERLEHRLLPFDAAELQRVVCWASEFPGITRGGIVVKGKCGAKLTSEQLYTKLIAPFRGEIRTPKLILVPHGPLHYVPFAALRDPKNGRYLLEDFTLTYAPSASALRYLRQKETPIDGGALVLGDPETGGRRRRLPSAQQEAVAVASDLGAKAVLGKKAAEQLLYGLNGKIDLVHVAAHADYDARNPLYSRIALAPSDGRDGNLEVHEILSEVDLTGVNLVVLSACSTAVGERSGGDEITGLTRALLYAGTPAVISTLWDIDDKAAATLMKEFYTRLLSGAPVAEALRGAQLVLLHTTVYREPRYWAAFTLTGDPQARWKKVPPQGRYSTAQ